MAAVIKTRISPESSRDRVAGRSVDVDEAAAVRADGIRRARGRRHTARATGGHAFRTLRLAAGPAPAGAAAPFGAAAAPRAEQDARLARVAAGFVLITVVHEHLQAIRVARHERDVPPGLRPVALVGQPRRDRIAAGE